MTERYHRPKSDRPTRWMFISDLQLGHSSAVVSDNDERARRLIELVAAEKPDFVINGGDHINGAVKADPSERANVKRMWRDYHRVMKPLQNVCPVISTVGNHDQTGAAASSVEYRRQTGRAGKPSYYARTIRGVHVVTVDTVVRKHRGGFAAGTVQARWLRRDLQRPRKASCTVVVGHYPILTASWLAAMGDPSLLFFTKQAGTQPVLLPMLLDARVDLYLCGHLHAYERARYQGMMQVMAGAPGIAFAEMREKPPGPYSKGYDERQGYIGFTLAGSSIRAKAVSLEGEVMDQWTQKLKSKESG